MNEIKRSGNKKNISLFLLLMDEEILADGNEMKFTFGVSSGTELFQDLLRLIHVEIQRFGAPH